MSERSNLEARLKWLRHEARIEGIWIGSLERNRAPEWLVDEHRRRQARLEESARKVEGWIAEITDAGEPSPNP